jgi:hypothetical protein
MFSLYFIKITVFEITLYSLETDAQELAYTTSFEKPCETTHFVPSREAKGSSGGQENPCTVRGARIFNTKLKRHRHRTSSCARRIQSTSSRPASLTGHFIIHLLYMWMPLAPMCAAHLPHHIPLTLHH